jgi:hypothetical protein
VAQRSQERLAVEVLIRDGRGAAGRGRPGRVPDQRDPPEAIARAPQVHRDAGRSILTSPRTNTLGSTRFGDDARQRSDLPFRQATASPRRRTAAWARSTASCICTCWSHDVTAILDVHRPTGRD